MKGKYLITTDNWFTAPDGCQYKSAWGDVTIVEDSFLGIKTNRMSANWFAKVGSEKNHIIIAGCQIHYAVRCEKKPETGYVKDWQADSSNVNIFDRPGQIYIAE